MSVNMSTATPEAQTTAKPQPARDLRCPDCRRYLGAIFGAVNGVVIVYCARCREFVKAEQVPRC